MYEEPPAIIETIEQEPAASLYKVAEKCELTLYYYDSCPYCKRVLRELDAMGKSVPMKNIQTSDAAYNELMTIGGKGQVPCLIINGKPLYESSSIITWLRENQDRY